jgi:hypothetical protein
MSLIHDNIVFKEDSILERSKKHDLANPLAVEMFLWDIEVSAQLQSLDNRLVLKGGAAAQLFLPLEKQRGSTDIDLKSTPSSTEQDISNVISQLGKRLPSLGLERHNPAAPNPKLPLVTYLVKVNSALRDMNGRSLEIKADILLRDPELPTIVVENRPTFALDVKRMRVPTLGTSIGDKLLTLAKESVGMTREEDYPKQMYDIDLLSQEISPRDFDDIVNAVDKLTPVEASYRELKTRPEEAIRHVYNLTTAYARIDTISGIAEHKRQVNSFQQFLVSRNQRLTLYDWASRALRIRFLATLVSMVLNDQVQSSDAVKKLKTAYRIAGAMERTPGNKVSGVRSELLRMIPEKIPHFKDLKGKPLSRVFWEAAAPNNLDKSESFLEAE